MMNSIADLENKKDIHRISNIENTFSRGNECINTVGGYNI